MKHSVPLRALVKELRELNEYYDGPGPVGLCVTGPNRYDGVIEWSVCQHDTLGSQILFGREEIPGDGLPFDAVGAARRLLSDYRNGVRP